MTILNLQVGAAADDVWHRESDHFVSTDGTSTAVGTIASVLHEGAVRFTGATIPQGARIDVAYLLIRAYVTSTGAPVKSILKAHAADASGAIANDADWHGVVDSELTLASAVWDNIGSWTSGLQYASPSLVSVIQELVDRPGWNEIVHIFWLDNGTTGASIIRHAISYVTNPANAVKLYIKYSVHSVRRRASPSIHTAAHVSRR